MLIYSKAYKLIIPAVTAVLVVGCANLAVTRAVAPPGYFHHSMKAANTFLKRNSDYRITYKEDRNKHKWHYEQGLMLTALYRMWLETGDPTYADFMVNNLDLYLAEDGTIKTYKQSNYKLDDITPGRAMLYLYQETGLEKYRLGAELLHKHLENQPRTREGGFWHKKIYPWQMWLDGLYMAGPFSAEYAVQFNRPQDFDDIVNQFVWAYSHTLDSETGLLYHGWDESREQEWADPETGLSASFWSRAMGWYLMALVDVLDYLPQEHPGRGELIGQLQDLSEAVMKYRDADTKTWYQVMDKGYRGGNYLESSTTAMFTYAFAKGARNGYLDKKYFKYARQSFDGFLKEFVITGKDGLPTITSTCSSAGLGGKTKRDGSYQYYLSEPVRSNDSKAIGPFIMAGIELEKGMPGK